MNSTEDYIGKKILMITSLTNNETLLAKNCIHLVYNSLHVPYVHMQVHLVVILQHLPIKSPLKISYH